MRGQSPSHLASLKAPFYLTGGTALSAFYLRHRLSEDLDFFTDIPDALSRVLPILETIAAGVGAKMVVRREFRTFLEAHIETSTEKVRVDFALDSPYRLEPVRRFRDRRGDPGVLRRGSQQDSGRNRQGVSLFFATPDARGGGQVRGERAPKPVIRTEVGRQLRGVPLLPRGPGKSAASPSLPMPARCESSGHEQPFAPFQPVSRRIVLTSPVSRRAGAATEISRTGRIGAPLTGEGIQRRTATPPRIRACIASAKNM